MQPCPDISRGTECTVPMPPGLVRLIVVPAKSSMVSLPLRARRTMSSYATQKPLKSRRSASLDAGDDELALIPLHQIDRKPEPDATPGVTTAGLPFTSANDAFISGWSSRARTSA